jgi:hypothetical protein
MDSVSELPFHRALDSDTLHDLQADLEFINRPNRKRKLLQKLLGYSPPQFGRLNRFQTDAFNWQSRATGISEITP